MGISRETRDLLKITMPKFWEFVMDERTKPPVMRLSRDMRKYFRLLTTEGYIITRSFETLYEINTKDGTLVAHVNDMGFRIHALVDDYDKVQAHKLNNFCVLMQKAHKLM